MEPDSRTRWRCRRGIREMDLILERFLGDGYGTLDGIERKAFDAILDLPDQDIYGWLMGHGSPPTPALTNIINHIRERTLEAPA
ncbi:MAG: antitoxin CptB [Gammaproteobacteria bacterium]|jgi:antitoxin CptB